MPSTIGPGPEDKGGRKNEETGPDTKSTDSTSSSNTTSSTSEIEAAATNPVHSLNVNQGATPIPVDPQGQNNQETGISPDQPVPPPQGFENESAPLLGQETKKNPDDASKQDDSKKKDPKTSSYSKLSQNEGSIEKISEASAPLSQTSTRPSEERETLVYVACSSMGNSTRPDFLAIVDVNENSADFCKITKTLELGTNESNIEPLELFWGNFTAWPKNHKTILVSSLYGEKITSVDVSNPGEIKKTGCVSAEKMTGRCGGLPASSWFPHTVTNIGSKKMVVSCSRAGEFECGCFSVVDGESLAVEKSWRWPDAPSCHAYVNEHIVSCHGLTALHALEPLDMSDSGMLGLSEKRIVLRRIPSEGRSSEKEKLRRSVSEISSERMETINKTSLEESRRGSESTSIDASSIAGSEMVSRQGSTKGIFNKFFLSSRSASVESEASGSVKECDCQGACSCPVKCHSDGSKSKTEEQRNLNKLALKSKVEFGTSEWKELQKEGERKFEALIERTKPALVQDDVDIVEQYVSIYNSLKEEFYDKSLYKGHMIFCWHLKKMGNPVYSYQSPDLQLPMKIRNIPGTNECFAIFGMSGAIAWIFVDRPTLLSQFRTCGGVERKWDTEIHHPVRMAPVPVSNWRVMEDRNLSYAPAMPSDIAISEDGQLMFVCNYLRGDVVMLDIERRPSDAGRHPRFLDQIYVGGIFANGHATLRIPDNEERAQHIRGEEIPVGLPPTKPIFISKAKSPRTEGIEEIQESNVDDQESVQIQGGPAHMTLSPDSKRLYVTNSLFPAWDKQFYKDDLIGKGGMMIRINIDRINKKMSLDSNFVVDFSTTPTRALPRGMLLISERKRRSSSIIC